MANAYRRMGNDAAALAGYEHYVQIDPKNAYAETDETNNEFAIPVPPAPCN